MRRTVGAALRERGWDDQELGDFLSVLEQRCKSPFPPIDEDSLAGGLADTIAGRLCNYFDFGGGFTVDGACSSSLSVIMGRAESLPTITLEASKLPLTRFIERPQVHYAGVELVAAPTLEDVEFLRPIAEVADLACPIPGGVGLTPRRVGADRGRTRW